MCREILFAFIEQIVKIFEEKEHEGMDIIQEFSVNISTAIVELSRKNAQIGNSIERALNVDLIALHEEMKLLNFQ